LIKHFNETIQGWDAGITQLYKKIIDQTPGPAHFVEVGAWKGKSASFMAVEIANGSKKIKFDCVDTWEGTVEDGHDVDEYVKNGTLYEHFLSNMKPVEGYYSAIRSSSVDAADLYKDNSLDFVFIDAAHDYENVKKDIAAWIQKVKIGGILGGHDIFHPPVANAVSESLTNFTRYNKQCWIYTKGI
jgi:predicted O-methyltransferase YrrM